MADADFRHSSQARAAAPPFEVWRTEAEEGEWTFQRLLGPVSVDAFACDYWGRGPLLVRGGGEAFYNSLITLAEIEALLGIPAILEQGMVSLRAKGEPHSLAPESVGHVYRRLGEGASLQFRKMERFLPAGSPLARLYRDVQLKLQHPGVSLSCFVTPPGAELLGAHFDETEVFTLQIAGRKRWRFFAEHVPEGRGPFPGQLGEPVQDVVLGPGDLLYHPRGQVHEVTCEGETSFSVPIVIDPLTWRTLLDQLVERLESRPEFIEALPADALLGEGACTRLAEGLAQRAALIAAEAAKLDVQALANRNAQTLLAGLGAAPGPQVQAVMAADAVDAMTPLLPRHGDAWTVAIRDGRAVLTLGGGDMLKMPAEVAPALRAIMARSKAAPAGSLHPSLSEQASVTLARRLVRAGALAPAEPEPTD